MMFFLSPRSSDSRQSANRDPRVVSRLDDDKRRATQRRLHAASSEALESRTLMAATPTTTLTATNITTATATETIRAVFKDSAGVNVSSIDINDLNITAPDGSTLSVSAVTTKSNGSGTNVTATYVVATPGSQWTPANDGTYHVTLADGQVTDNSSGPADNQPGGLLGLGIGPLVVGPASTTFTVSVVDNVVPTAQIIAPAVTSAGASTYQFAVVYTDNFAINAASIDTADVSVTGPPGVGALSILSASASSGSASVVTATYTFAAPGGAFAASDNGTYSIAIKARQVTDTAGNAVAAKVATFPVSITKDKVPPTGSLSANSITDSSGSGAASTIVTAVYDDAGGIRASDFSTANIQVTGPSGALTVSAFTVVASSATSDTVQYTVNAPGGSFDSTDNGNYAVTLVGGQIHDLSGNVAAPATTSFNVSLTPPDNVPPTASVQATDISASGVPEVVTVVYTDNRAVRGSSIGADDISVSGPGGAISVASFSSNTSNDSATITATYVLAIPGSAWTSVDNGAYTVSVNAGGVRDTSNNAVTPSSGTFNVFIPIGDPSDPGFAQGASTSTSFLGAAAVVAPNGQIYVAGQRNVTGGTQGVIERLNSNGTVDTSFGNGGIVTTTGLTDSWYALTLQGTDHLIAAGASNGDFALERFDLSGNVDSTFNNNTGKATADFATTADVARAIAISPDGSLIAGGDASGNFAFAKFSADGVLDTSFGQAGRQIFSVGTGGSDMLGSAVVQSDGKIIGVGATGGNVAVVRARADGSPDSTFSTDGEITLNSLATRQDSTAPDTSEGVALQADGKILIANHTSDGHFGVTRLNTDGSIDTTFGANGLATASFGGVDDADAVVVQSSGQILVIGTSIVGTSGRTAVAAFDANGNLIPAFGQAGLATLGSAAVPAGVTPDEAHVGTTLLRAFATQQSDGRLIVGTSDAADSSQTSQLRRVVVPGSVSSIPTQTPGGTSLGSFGTVNGKRNVRLSVTSASGEVTTFSLTNATGAAFQTGGTVRLSITNVVGKAGATLTITTRGSTRRVALGDVSVVGSLARINAPTADLSGTLYVAGALRTANLGIISGNVAVAGAIGAFTAAGLTSGRIFSGAHLGADGLFGGGDDTYTAGSIASVRINGAMTDGLIAAGLEPGNDGTFLDSDDSVIGGAASLIKTIVVRTPDAASHFVAGAFKHASLPRPVKSIAADPRFLTT